MLDFVLLFCNISFLVCETVSAYFYSDCIDRLLNKDRRWINGLLGSVSIMLILTLVYTWLPGRIGAEVTLFEELITLKDGALFQNLAMMSIAQALAIGIAVVKYLWAVIRRKQKFSLPFLAVEFLFAAAFCTAGVYLAQNETVIPFENDTGAAYVVTGLIALAGLILFIWLSVSDTEEKKPQAQDGRKNRKERNQSRTSPQQELENYRFEQLVQKKNFLTEKGDFASQIPLLTEATGWKLDKEKKARVWNYLGMAYEQIGSGERAEECYRTASKIR